MKLVYKAHDNVEFDNEAECLHYENALLLLEKENEVKESLNCLVKSHCDYEDYEGYASKDIAEFIFKHFDKIKAVLNK